MYCAFLPLFNPNLDFLQAAKVMKSGRHLLQEQASKGYGSIPDLMSQASLHKCLQGLNMMGCDVNPGKDPCPLLAPSCNK